MGFKIAYWVSTALFCAVYGLSVVTYVTDPAGAAASYAGIGYPAYLVGMMIFVKLAGIAAVLVRRPLWLAQLAYAGFLYHLLLAFSAHVAAGVPGFEMSLILLALVIVSFATQNDARRPAAAYAPVWRHQAGR